MSWFISTTGSDTGTGSISDPFQTIDKALTVCSSGDIIKILNGSYSVGTININKGVTITSDSGITSNVILTGSGTIFNLQHSNITISYLTLISSASYPLISISISSTGSTPPTYLSNNTITYCYLQCLKGLELTGSFNVTYNTINSSVVDIYVYNTRGGSITNNTFNSTSSKTCYLTNNYSGSYYDECASKGGVLNISSNTINNTSSGNTFLFMDYFNQYLSNTISYNINTKLYFVISYNILSLSTKGKFINLVISNVNDLNTIGNCSISNNNINNTDYGILHLSKFIDGSNITITNTRPIFKIYNNTLDTAVSPSYIWDASVLSSLSGIGGASVANVGDNVINWGPSTGTVASNTTFSMYPTASTNYPTLNTVNSKYAIKTKINAILAMPDTVISSINTTVFVALRWVLPPGDSIAFGISIGSDTTGSSYLYNSTGTVLLFIRSGGAPTIQTGYILTAGVTYIYMLSYNSSSQLYNVTVSGLNLKYTDINGQYLSNSGDWCLGGIKKAGTTGWACAINVHEVRFYNSILSDSSINSISSALLTKWS